MDVPDARAVDGHLAIADPVAGHSAMPLFQSHPELHPRQVRAEAAVRAASEGDVPVWLSVGAELVRRFEHRLVTIGRGVEQAQGFAGGDLLVVQLDAA